MKDKVSPFDRIQRVKLRCLTFGIVCAVVSNALDLHVQMAGAADCFANTLGRHGQAMSKWSTNECADWQGSCFNVGERRSHMPTETAPSTQPRVKMFLDIPTAAEMAGFSLRHFRRIIEEDQIPVIQIGRKFFILGRDFSTWKEGKKERRAV